MVVFCGQLMQQAEALLDMGLHPSEIISGYELAANKALELIQGHLALFSLPSYSRPCASAWVTCVMISFPLLSPSPPSLSSLPLLSPLRSLRLLPSTCFFSSVCHGIKSALLVLY